MSTAAEQRLKKARCNDVNVSENTEIFSDFTLWRLPVVLSLTIFQHNWRDRSQLWTMTLVNRQLRQFRQFRHDHCYIYTVFVTTSLLAIYLENLPTYSGSWKRNSLQCDWKVTALSLHWIWIENSLLCNTPWKKLVARTRSIIAGENKTNLPIRSVRMVIYLVCWFLMHSN